VLKSVRRFTGKYVVSPFTRTAIMAFLWTHRHEVLRWGRSLWEHLARRDLEPAAAMRTARVLFAVASDERFRDAKQLRRVTMANGVVDLQVQRRWALLPALVESVAAVNGVLDVTVNGQSYAAPIDTTARSV
jgi:hypothetical protein